MKGALAFAAALVLCFRTASAWAPHAHPTILRPRKARVNSRVWTSSRSGGGDDPQEAKKKRSFGRISSPFESTTNIGHRDTLRDDSESPWTLAQIAAAVILSALSLSLSSFIFSSDEDFYFTSESVTVTQTRNADGTVNTDVERSVKSNVPGIEGSLLFGSGYDLGS